MSRTEISTRRLMALVVVNALGLGVFRTHALLGCLVASMLSVALIRTWEMTDRFRKHRRWNVVRTFLESVVVAITILALAALPAVLIMPIIDAPPRSDTKVVLGLAISVIAAILISIAVRRTLWSPRSLPSSEESPDRSIRR